jgi:TrmH family RNA methyltransferase
VKPITSVDNPNFRRWLRLAESPREVRLQGRTLAEGPHLAEAIHAAHRPVEALLVRRAVDRTEVRGWIDTFAATGVPAFELGAGLFDRLAPVERGSGLLLLICVPDAPPLQSGDALFLDGVQDPGNAGALLRVAAAAGVRTVLASPGTVALWSPKVLRGGQGAHFRLGLHEDVVANEVHAKLPMPWIGATAHAGTPLWAARLTHDAAGFMVGAEGGGLSPAATAACDELVTIPLAGGIESLNVASAAAVCLFERRRQLRTLHPRSNPSA